jgi:pilus assembly protein CpaF
VTAGSLTQQRVSADLVLRVQQRLADRADAVATVPTAAAVAAAVRAEAGMLISDAQMLQLIRALQHEIVGTGPLAELLADPATTDVVVNGPHDVRVDRGAGWEQTGIRFADDAAVQRLARRLASAAGRRLDEAQPYVDAQLPGGIRLHAVLPPITSDGTCVSLRVLRPAQFDLATLGRHGAFPPTVESLLRRIVRARLAVMISGGTGSGKTTLLAALLGEVDPAERIITVEDAGELRPTHPHVLHLLARTSNVEGAGRIELRDLVRQGLRMRPDRLVVGEVRGAEVIDLLVALNTGHRGGAGTVHANAADEVPARLAALAALGGMAETTLNAQLPGAVQVIIHLERVPVAGRAQRRVSEIAVLERDPGGGVTVRRACDDNGWPGPGAARLASLLDAAPQPDP